jgi:hypothetical protein
MTQKLDIANEYKPIEKPPEAIEHYLGYHQKNWKYPQVFLYEDPDYSSSADGGLHIANAVWATARGASSADVAYTSSSIATQAQGNGTYYITRAFFPFDTSGLDGSTIADARLSVDFAVASDNGGEIGLIQTTQADTSTLDVDDYNNITLNSPDEGIDTRRDIGAINAGGTVGLMTQVGQSWDSGRIKI